MKRTKKPWWQYPANINRDYNPWYVIAWRSLWFPLFAVGYGAAHLARFIASGSRR